MQIMSAEKRLIYPVVNVLLIINYKQRVESMMWDRHSMLNYKSNFSQLVAVEGGTGMQHSKSIYYRTDITECIPYVFILFLIPPGEASYQPDQLSCVLCNPPRAIGVCQG